MNMGATRSLWSILVFISLFCFDPVTNWSNINEDDNLFYAKANHRSVSIDERHFWQISDALSDIEDIHTTLPHILVERVSGTPQHAVVKNFIVNRMRNLGWDVEENKFKDRTPIDEVDRPFTNIIARLNPNAKRFLVLACHYDSKLMKGFVGATDSAVPCTIMMNLAHTLTQYFETRKNTDLSLMFIFFDGEEAFKTWNAHDSIYGARHLAKEWHSDNKLKHIDVLVLLDLLGAPNPKFYDHFPDSTVWYNLLVDIETRLGAFGGLVEHVHSSSTIRKRHEGMFQPYKMYNMGIEDDHIPFLRRQVPILHVIPTPFPDVWHTTSDNINAIDFATVTNLNKIFGIFCLEYLQIDVGPFFLRV